MSWVKHVHNQEVVVNNHFHKSDKVMDETFTYSVKGCRRGAFMHVLIRRYSGGSGYTSKRVFRMRN